LISHDCKTRRPINGHRAQEEFVSALEDRVRSLAGHYSRLTRQDRHDLEQEAWLHIFTALETIDSDAQMTPSYLVQLARWRLLDAARRWQRQHRDSDLASMPIEAHHSVKHDTSSVYVDEFLEELNPKQRAIVDALLEGATWRETGSRLGFSSANVGRHLRTIQARYQEYDGDDSERKQANTGTDNTYEARK
jgi:RNA polymerase sigma factor (sigma-70 family)